MITVKYISGAEKKTFILNQNYEMAIKECNPHSTTWGYESVTQQFGAKITSFTKDVITLSITFKFRGSEQAISNNLNDFFAECDRDVLNMKQGELWIGDEYIRGYFTERSTNPASEFYGYEQTAVFTAPYPFWVREKSKEFFPGGEAATENFLDYNHDYNYDYTMDSDGSRNWYIDHYADSEFEMRIYGPCENPRINIDGYPYQIFDTLESGEYAVIDSRSNTIEKHLSNGTTSNIYDLRAKEQSVFRKIPAGNLPVSWTGTFGFDVVLYLERSEPRWN